MLMEEQVGEEAYRMKSSRNWGQAVQPVHGIDRKPAYRVVFIWQPVSAYRDILFWAGWSLRRHLNEIIMKIWRWLRK